MAWTTPRTWAAGEVLTDALLNAQIRDNFNAIVNDGVNAIVIARGTDASMPSSDAPLRITATYTGTAVEESMMAVFTFTDNRTTGNFSSQALRIAFNRSSTATAGGSAQDAALLISSTMNATLTTMFSLISLSGPSVAATKTLTDYRGLYISNAGGAGTVTTQYGIKIDTLNKGGTNYAIYTDLGIVRFGDRADIAGVRVTADPGSGLASTVTLSGSTIATGGGAPATPGTVARWWKVYDGTTVRYIPMYS